MISYACTLCHKNLNTGTSSTIILSCFSSGIFVVHSYLCMFQYVYSAMYALLYIIVSILACTQPV